MNNIQIKKDKYFLELKVPANKKKLVGLYSFVMSIIFTFIAFISGYFLYKDGQLIAGLISLFLFFGLSGTYFNGYIWLKNGFEILKIDKKLRVVTLAKVGFLTFHKRRLSLDEIQAIQICDRDVDSAVRDSEAAWLYGYGRGKICIYTHKRGYQFGNSIDHEKSIELVSILNSFILPLA